MSGLCSAQRSQLQAGAARVDITPAPESLPETSFGILDHCFTRAIVFTNGFNKAAFVSFDGAMINARLVEAVNKRAAAELGIPEGNIMYNWTHTHSGASVSQDELVERTFRAVSMANSNMVPAQVGYGAGVSYLNVKRDLFDSERGTWWEGPDCDGKSDKTVAVIYFRTMEGAPIACYFNYAMHAVLSGNLDMVSGDFPGAASRYIENGFDDGFVAIFAAGAAGDQNPRYFQQTFDLRDIRIKDYASRGEDISNKMPPGGQGLDRSNPEVARLMNEQKQMVESYGQILGEEVRHTMNGIRRFENKPSIICSHKQVSVPGRHQINGGGRAGYEGKYEDAEPAKIDLHLTMIDDIPVIGTSGEPYNPIAVRLKRESPYARTMLTMLCQGVFTGYIPDDESYGAQTFEVLGSRFKQGYAESAIVNGSLDLIHEATHNPSAQRPLAPSDPYFEMKVQPCMSQGKKLYGEMYTPRYGLNKKPVVIMAHGFNGTHYGYYDIISELARDGFICYAFDFSGGSVRSMSEGDTRDMTIFTERQNLLDVVDMFKEMKGVDTDNIFLIGESQGGLVAAMAAAQAPEKIKAIALMYPALGIPASAVRMYPDHIVPDSIEVMGMPLGGDYYRSLFGYDIYKDAPRFTGDVLIVHGDADRLVNKSVSERLNPLYRSSELHIINGGDHGFSDSANRAECRNCLRKFFNAQLNTVENEVPCLASPAHQLQAMPQEYALEADKKGEVVRLDYKTKKKDGKTLDKYLKVYLPYGYDQDDKNTKYNVFYLLHGGNGNPEHYWMWRNPSLKNIIDNMIQRGELDPLIIVTPTYYPPERTSGGVDDVEIFHDELMHDIIPLVEGKFNTYAKNTRRSGIAASRSHRAFGGFSLGAACTWWQFIQSLDAFRWFMPMSGDCWAVRSFGAADGQDYSEATAEYLVKSLSKYPAKYSGDFFIYSMTGDRDIAYSPVLKQMAALQNHPEFRFNDDFSKGNIYFSVMHSGFHSFEYINQYIYYALPYFFK